LIEMANAYYAIHGPLLARSIKTELHPNKSKAHEGHGAAGDKITFTVTLRNDYGGLNMTFMPPTCGILANNIINMDAALAPPMSGVQVWWRLSAFRDHGSFNDMRGRPMDGSIPTETDPSGQTTITFQARQEPANGQGELKSIKANIRASFDPRPAIEARGLTEPRLLMFLPGSMDVTLPENITLEWHESASFTGEGKYRKAVMNSGVGVSAAYSFSITFHALENGTIEGTGTLTKTEAPYGGQGMECKDIGTSALSYPPLEVTGKFTPAAPGQTNGKFQLVIKNQPSTNTWQWECSMSYAGKRVVVQTIDEGVDAGPAVIVFDIAATDGAQANGMQDLGGYAGTTGSATWDLLIHKVTTPSP
jgi:hypothetical protein